MNDKFIFAAAVDHFICQETSTAFVLAASTEIVSTSFSSINLQEKSSDVSVTGVCETDSLKSCEVCIHYINSAKTWAAHIHNRWISTVATPTNCAQSSMDTYESLKRQIKQEYMQSFNLFSHVTQ